MATPAELLSKIDLFADLDRGELRDVAGGTKEYSFAAGREIVTEGESGVGFFVISSGTASVSIGGKTVRTLGTGDYFGEVALIAEAPRTASVTAETDVTAYGISSWAFRPIVENNGKLAWKLLQVLAKHLSSG
jgi:CRP-like cAMP-binding protein